MSQPECIDRATLDALLESVGGDREFLVELIDTYLADAPQLVASIRRAAATGNAEELRRAAHTLKSNSASFGALTLAQLSRELEELGRAGSVAGAAERLPPIEAEYEQVRRALLAERAVGEQGDEQHAGRNPGRGRQRRQPPVADASARQ